MPKKILHCYSARHEDNLLLWVSGEAGGNYTGAFIGLSFRGASAGFFSIPALLGGVCG